MLLHPLLCVAALQPRLGAPRMMAAYDWVDKRTDELNLLPFGLEELLLPGETKQVHLYEARFLALFEEAEASHDSCVGQLLITPNGNVAAVTSLLEIEESRRQEVGVWARLRCVGRVRVADLEQTDYGYVRAEVGLVTDGGDDPVDEEALSECLEAHAACRDLEIKLLRRGSSDAEGEDEDSPEGGVSGLPPSLAGLAEQLGSLGSGAATQVEWGHEVSDVGELSYDKPLPELVAARREKLCFRGLDLPPGEGLDERVQRVWGAESEAEAEAQLLSFAAAACLGERERATALRETSTLERLQSATAAFRESQRRLAAELALADAAGGAPDA